MRPLPLCMRPLPTNAYFYNKKVNETNYHLIGSSMDETFTLILSFTTLLLHTSAAI